MPLAESIEGIQQLNNYRNSGRKYCAVRQRALGNLALQAHITTDIQHH